MTLSLLVAAVFLPDCLTITLMAEIQFDNLRNQGADEHPQIVEVELVTDSRQVEKGNIVNGKRKKGK
ncbi:hypothetical protein SLEP1_g24504 [Rubroshorea leprosula]|uniref:Uncharacterized protein n=1 Tax=Rubroshorea leprosula TaxID=152421 RepID=A0AAV5JG60_9ROSI|nr:hypothetical protein SLEP1_g24504 [Rubroshorea leprosula]